MLTVRRGTAGNRRQFLRRLKAVFVAGASVGVSGCSNSDSGSGGLVTIQEHSRDGAQFVVTIKNGHPVQSADVTAILTLLDDSDTVIGRKDRQVTIDSGTSQRIEFEIRSRDVDGNLEDVASYRFDLEGEKAA